MFVNWRLISHPVNWIIILLMLVIAGMFGHYVLTTFDQEPASKETLPSGLGGLALQ